jgi:hypothetical protein
MSLSNALYIARLTIDLIFYYLATLGFLGIWLNLLGIVVFCRKKLRDMTMSLYNIMLASVNILALSIQFVFYMPLFYGKNSLVWSQASCVLLHYSQRVFITYSPCIDMMIAIDRTIFILYKTRYRFLLKKRNVFGILMGMFAIMVVLNLQMTR